MEGVHAFKKIAYYLFLEYCLNEFHVPVTRQATQKTEVQKKIVYTVLASHHMLRYLGLTV